VIIADTLEKLEQASQTEDDSNEIPPADIVAYNELRSCADLARMHEEVILQITPDFQRDIVWQGTHQTEITSGRSFLASCLLA
jgi:hypothetical protein